MKIKIMSYNILTGFHDFDKKIKLNFKRLKAAQKLIKKENPDILLLNETYFGIKNQFGIIMDYKKLFDFPYYFYGNNKNKNSVWGEAVFSKHPIVYKKNLSNGWNMSIRTKIKIKNRTINLDEIHLFPMSKIKNAKQRIFLEKIIGKNVKRNYVIAGDFNSISPDDEYNKRRMVKAWSRFTEEPKEVIEEMLKRKVIKSVLSKGLIDTLKKNNKKNEFTIPTDFLSKKKDSSVRIDYIFCSKDFKVLKSRIIKNKLAEKASDHYPIVAVLELK